MITEFFVEITFMPFLSSVFRRRIPTRRPNARYDLLTAVELRLKILFLFFLRRTFTVFRVRTATAASCAARLFVFLFSVKTCRDYSANDEDCGDDYDNFDRLHYLLLFFMNFNFPLLFNIIRAIAAANNARKIKDVHHQEPMR